MRRVVITGMGITSPLGSTVKDAFERLKIYKNCVEHWEKLDEYERLNTSLGAFAKGFEIPEHFTSRQRQMCIRDRSKTHNGKCSFNGGCYSRRSSA